MFLVHFIVARKNLRAIDENAEEWCDGMNQKIEGVYKVVKPGVVQFTPVRKSKLVKERWIKTDKSCFNDCY